MLCKIREHRGAQGWDFILGVPTLLHRSARHLRDASLFGQAEGPVGLDREGLGSDLHS